MPNQNHLQSQARIIYFSHGGGPLPILGDSSHRAMVAFMRNLPPMLGSPDAILVISAHWEELKPTLTGAKTPPLLYDYYGFPDEAYDITYPAPGSPGLAKRIASLLMKKDIPVYIDTYRGFDHGLFIPLKLMYPQAEIPAIQLSLVRGLDPGAHIRLGNALQELMAENILIIGSGFSFHNMKTFSRQGKQVPDPANDAFQDWLISAITSPLPRAEREHLLMNWEKAPFARYCHPTEEHLLPLHVCLGMANKAGTTVFDDAILGKRGVAFLW